MGHSEYKKAKVELPVTMEVFDSIDQVGDEWNGMGEDHLFLSVPFLRSLERRPPVGLVPYYLLFRNEEGIAVGKAYFQNKTFRGSESLKVEKSDSCPSFFSHLAFQLRELTTRKVEFESLSCGHITLSGNYGYSIPNVPSKEQHRWIDAAVQKVCEHISAKGKEISIILLKDFPEESRFSENTGVGPSFFEFQIQPGMVLTIGEDWSEEQDYLAAMTSKYRTRYKRARKKMDGVERRLLEKEDIEKFKTDCYELYRKIADGSDFNLFFLDQDFLPVLKEELGHQLLVHGYFFEDKIIGFTTLILDGRHADAHIIGFLSEYNRSHQLYQNMLYDMAVDAVQHGAKQLDYARTALEIKSTVGAEPKKLYCYMRHQKPMYNGIVPKLFNFLAPTEDWVQRRPFKHQSA